MSQGMAESELLTDNRVLRQVRRAISYEFRTELEIAKKYKATVRVKFLAGLEPEITGVVHLRNGFPKRESHRSRENSGDTLSD
jgi:hypothetical protein